MDEIIRKAASGLQAGGRAREISELTGAAKALFLFSLWRETRRPLLIVTPSGEDAETLAEDLRFFTSAMAGPGSGGAPEVRLFPLWGVLPFEADSPDSATVGERMRFLYGLLEGERGIFIAPAGSIMQKLPPWELFADAVRTFTPGQEAEPGDTAAALAATGYEATTTVTRVGEVSRRGGIVDFFSPAHEQPVRMEFFGDTIESLRHFDPETQRSTGDISRAVALPVRELLVTDEGTARLEKQAGPGLAGQMEQDAFPPGVEFLAPFFYTMDTVFRFVPDTSLVAVIEPDDCRKAVDEQFQKAQDGRREEAEEGRMLPETGELYLDAAGVDRHLAAFPAVHLRLLGSAADTVRMDTRSPSWLGVRISKALAADSNAPPLEGTAAGLAEKLKAWRGSNRISIVCGTEESRTRLMSLFREYGLFMTPAQTMSPEGEAPWPVRALTGRLSEGFSWPALGLIVITEEEIFGSKVHRPRASRSRAAPFLSSFKELKPGDFVVHTDYGVGEYQGLSHISVDGFETDFLALRYEPDARLYVPLYSLDKVQKYIGTEGAPPKLNRLGAPAWARTKERVKKDLLEMARELAAVYAAREAMQRPPLSAPDNLYREFEAAFPFEETPDQMRAIEDVLADMQKPRPMDRLVCGDVGFGKTEVALRAAFKAVEDGYQAAVLVPTTLLADQHYRNFAGRLGPFPARVDMLSRFRTKAEQKETLAALKAGTVDIVIGTHRLLQRDVAFRRLGLLVVDEEHRFGVKHKERIKEMRRMVDVLTLTATPIPRTLHMSLAGIRDLSIIQTPPLDRQAIQVVLARFGKRVIREAVLAELGRGGQVFFVQNRVAGIERMAAYLQNLVPEAKIGVAHGQMKEDEIEAVMGKFISGELTVLVTTTIIESGIDIPNANTIIINRADRFGLADLYQIKGRVGRSRQKAWAYLLTPAEEALSDTARQRLRAIQELSELGAGFRIAAHDLEARGAGNLLGKQQSGHIAAVGIDLYTEMMEEAMAELRGEERAPEPDTQINLKVSAFIPETYIGDMSLRLAAYKEISAVQDDDELRQIAADLEDRYGPLPEEAANLLRIMSVKLAAARAGVARVDGGAGSVHITFSEGARIAPDKVMALLNRNRGKIKLIPEYTLQVLLPDSSLAAAEEAVKKCLQALG